MNLFFWSVGSKHESYVKEGIEEFTKRINRYYSCKWQIVPPPKNAANLSVDDQKNQESRHLISQFTNTDFVVLLDERGKMLSSPQLGQLIEKQAGNSIKSLHFIIGGAFGVNDELRQRANFTWQLSQLVFPHQLVRLMLSEQIYRACSINNNEKYHHI